MAELTLDILRTARDRLLATLPTLYYVVSDAVPEGQVICVPASEQTPPYCVFHSQGEVEEAARRSGRRLMHLREYRGEGWIDGSSYASRT